MVKTVESGASEDLGVSSLRALGCAKKFLNQLKIKHLAFRVEQVWVGQGAVTDEGSGRGGEA